METPFLSTEAVTLTRLVETPSNYLKVDIADIISSIKYDENSFISSQDIEQKPKRYD